MIVQDCLLRWTRLFGLDRCGIGFFHTSVVALTRREIASLDPVASTRHPSASTEVAFASTNSSQFVPRMEAIEAVEAIPHTFAGFSGELESILCCLTVTLAYAKGRDALVRLTARHFRIRNLN